MGKWKTKQDRLSKRFKKDPVTSAFFHEVLEQNSPIKCSGCLVTFLCALLNKRPLKELPEELKNIDLGKSFLDLENSYEWTCPFCSFVNLSLFSKVEFSKSSFL